MRDWDRGLRQRASLGTHVATLWTYGTADGTAVCTSNDGGVTWTLTAKPPVSGAIFCLAYVAGTRHSHDGEFSGGDDEDRDLERAVVVTAETEPDFDSGSAAWTPDEGRTWFPIPGVSGYWAVAFANPEAGWFVGNNGQILKISFAGRGDQQE